MPLLWPAQPNFVNDSERRVWTALNDQLGENDLLIANQRFIDRERDYEVDIVVVFDGGGVVVLEIKGGTVWNADGQWWQKSPEGDRKIFPVDQAMKAKHMLQDYVYESAAWGSLGKIRWVHAVCFPDTAIDMRFDTPDCHRQMVIDRGNLADIAGLLRTLVDIQETTARPCTGQDIVAIHEALSGRFLPQRNAIPSGSDLVELRDEVTERLSAEQAVILDAIQLLPRVEVRGGAGSGKTWLAVEQARRLAKKGERVALLSYSRGLAAWMQRRVATFDRKEQPAYVGTFHGIGAEWGTPDGSDDDSDFWETQLPAIMLDLAREQIPANLYDSIIIDEAQDFADAWWPVVLAALKYEDGGLYVFSDEGQRIFSRFGNAPAGLVPLVLEQNLRNTKQISQTFTSMAPNRMRASTYDGPAVRFHACAAEDAINAADDMVVKLMDEGWEASDIAVLSTGNRHPEQKHRQEAGWESYWDSFWDKDQVFYGHVMGFKGLERPCVVLAVNEKPGIKRAKERLYVGLSRARDLLVVCGDPEHIEDVGGPAGLKKLGG